MAVTVTLYNHTAKLFANSEIDLTSLKLVLLDSTPALDITDTTINDILNLSPQPEVSGFGWDAGGEPIANAVITITTTNDATLDADDVSVTATGGAIGPARYAVIYADMSGFEPPLAWIDFGQEEEAGQDTDFKVVWNVLGIVTWTYPG